MFAEHLLPHVTVHSAIDSIGIYSYFAIFLLTFLSGHIIPLPEEILLLAVGYSAGVGITNFWLAIPAAILGLLAGDSLFYWLGHHGGKWVEKFEHRLPRKTMEMYSARFNTNPVMTIVCMRFISGIRIFSPLFAGAWRIPFRLYILADLGALCVYTFLYIGLGYFFNNALGSLIGRVSAFRHLVFLGILLLLTIFLLYHAYRIFFGSTKEADI